MTVTAEGELTMWTAYNGITAYVSNKKFTDANDRASSLKNLKIRLRDENRSLTLRLLTFRLVVVPLGHRSMPSFQLSITPSWTSSASPSRVADHISWAPS